MENILSGSNSHYTGVDLREKGGSQAKPLLMAGMIGGLYDFIVATFGWWNENFTTRVCSAGEMLAEKAKLVFKVNAWCRQMPSLGYIYRTEICFHYLPVHWLCGGLSFRECLLSGVTVY